MFELYFLIRPDGLLIQHQVVVLLLEPPRTRDTFRGSDHVD
jgi:hypothetical protein